MRLSQKYNKVVIPAVFKREYGVLLKKPYPRLNISGMTKNFARASIIFHPPQYLENLIQKAAVIPQTRLKAMTSGQNSGRILAVRSASMASTPVTKSPYAANVAKPAGRLGPTTPGTMKTRPKKRKLWNLRQLSPKPWKQRCRSRKLKFLSRKRLKKIFLSFKLYLKRISRPSKILRRK